MAFDLHQLDQLRNDSDAITERLQDYIAELIEEFARSTESEQLLNDVPALAEGLGGWIHSLLDMGYGYEQVLLPQMTQPQVERLVEAIFPRKISLLSATEATEAIPELMAFWQFLQRVYKLPNARKIITYLKRVAPQFPALMMDKNNFGIAKAFFSSGQAMGFDMTTQAGLQEFQTTHHPNQLLNQRHQTRSKKPPKGFGELLATDQPTQAPSNPPKVVQAKGFGKSPSIDSPVKIATAASGEVIQLDAATAKRLMLFGQDHDDDDESAENGNDFHRSLQRGMWQSAIDALPPLSVAQAELLQQQAISVTTPGTILADFQHLLDFVGTEGIPVSPTHQLILVVSTLAALNQTLTIPMSIDLKRPQQKSYPSINGLYLLLRCTGVGRITQKGKQHSLVIDPMLLQHWQQLNPTEQYFTLLEAWLIRSHEEVLGERSGPMNEGTRVIQSWQNLARRGKHLAKYNDQNNLVYYPGLLNLGLMQLFGLVNITSVKPEAGKGWRFKSVRPSPWGNVVIRLVTQAYYEHDMIWEAESDAFATFGDLQTTFQPYFPAWQQNLPGLSSEFQPGLFTFKVSLGKIWRRIAVSGETSLADLADLILTSVEFDDDHLDMFSYKDPRGHTRKIFHPAAESRPQTNRVKVGELLIATGAVMEYLFDFGDCWRFQLCLESIVPKGLGTITNAIIETHGKAPEQYPDWD
jgi:Plasmid pRiA4b ORF-3-like protein